MKEEVASSRLREMVVRFKESGFPAPFADPGEARKELGADAAPALSAFLEEAQVYHRKAEKGRPQEEGTPWWEAVVRFRKALQLAVEAGLVRVPSVHRYVFEFGALPDPETGWRYYVEPNGLYACWECGTVILQKTVRDSIWHTELPCAGSGEVRPRIATYCPVCDPEPQDGVVKESLAESLAREHRFVPGG